jgi:DNA polymerase III epsilon subunit family exonuclease
LTAQIFSAASFLDAVWHELPFYALDVETTGLDPSIDRIIELALVPFNMPNAMPYCQLFSIDEPLPREITNITGISDEMLKGKPTFKESVNQFLPLLEKASFVVAYNAKFDRPFLESELARLDMVLPDIDFVDPYIFICELDRYKKGKKLFDAAKRWGVNLDNAHRAMADAEAAGKLMLKLADKINVSALNDLLKRQKIWQWRNAQNVAELKRVQTWRSTDN